MLAFPGFTCQHPSYHPRDIASTNHTPPTVKAYWRAFELPGSHSLPHAFATVAPSAINVYRPLQCSGEDAQAHPRFDKNCANATHATLGHAIDTFDYRYGGEAPTLGEIRASWCYTAHQAASCQARRDNTPQRCTREHYTALLVSQVESRGYNIASER